MVFKVKIEDKTILSDPEISINKLVGLPTKRRVRLTFNISPGLLIEEHCIVEELDVENTIIKMYKKEIYSLYCMHESVLPRAHEFIERLYKGKTVEELLAIKKLIEES